MSRLQRGLGIGLIFALLVLLSAAAQEEPYARILVRALTREGWTQQAAGDLVREMSQKGWDFAPKGDPQAVAFAMGAVLQSQNQYNNQEMAQLAWGVAEAGGELAALGYQSREIAAACASGLQTMLQTQTRTPSAEGELAARIRTAATRRIQDGTCDDLQTQTKTQTHAGPGAPGAAPGAGPGPGPGPKGSGNNKPE